MRQLNGVYTQRFNRRHGEVGHLFQGRYKAILVQKEYHLLELTRYVVLNPLRAGMVKEMEAWTWSSYCATIGVCEAPDWLDRDWLLNQFGQTRRKAVSAYRRFVRDGVGLSSPLDEVRHQLLPGDDAFVDRHKKGQQPEMLRNVTKAHRRAVSLTLEEYKKRHKDRGKAMVAAYSSGSFTMGEIGEYFEVHAVTVGRAVRKYENNPW